MFRNNRWTPILLVAGLAFGGVLVRMADQPKFLFGLGTDFISGFMFGVGIILALRAIAAARAT